MWSEKRDHLKKKKNVWKKTWKKCEKSDQWKKKDVKKVN